MPHDPSTHTSISTDTCNRTIVDPRPSKSSENAPPQKAEVCEKYHSLHVQVKLHSKLGDGKHDLDSSLSSKPHLVYMKEHKSYAEAHTQQAPLVMRSALVLYKLALHLKE